MLATLPNSQHHLSMPSQHTHADARSLNAPSATLVDHEEERLCGGCNRSVNSERGVVVAFGNSLWHVECFKCAKCGNQVNPDTNLLLLSDGSPVCANCYNCKVCNKPILDEAVMTGEDSYHAACFTCRTCHKRIDELVFAKTSQGFYCMKCHNERVARSRRHMAKKQTKERERQASSGNGAAKDGRPGTGSAKPHIDPASADQKSHSRDYAASPSATQLEHAPSPHSSADGHTQQHNRSSPLHSPLASHHPSTASSSASVPENVAGQSYTAATNGVPDSIPTFTLESLTMSPEMNPSSPPLTSTGGALPPDHSLPPSQYATVNGGGESYSRNGRTSPQTGRSSGSTPVTAGSTGPSAPTSPTSTLAVRSDSSGNYKLSGTSHNASNSVPALSSPSTLAFLSPDSAEMFKNIDVASANYPASGSGWPTEMEQHKRRKSFDDGVGPVSVVNDETDENSAGLSIPPLNVAKSKREKRGSIDPRMRLEPSKWQHQFASLSAETSISQSPTTPGAPGSSALTPTAQEHARTPTTPVPASSRESPKSSPLDDYFNEAENDVDSLSVERKSNSSNATNGTTFYSPAASPQPSINKGESPTSTSRSMTAPVPSTQAKNVAATEILAKPPSRSDSLRLNDGVGRRQNDRLLPLQQVLRPKRSFDERVGRLSPRLKAEFGASDMGRRSRSVSPKPPDVPHGIESGTDTEADPDGDNDDPDSQVIYTHRREPSSPLTALPPALPPKDPQLTPLPSNAAASTPAPTPAVDGPTSKDKPSSPMHSRVASRDSDMQDEAPSPVFTAQERTSAFFVAPALPPMRFSINGTDFKDILNSLGGVTTTGRRPSLPKADGEVNGTASIAEETADDVRKASSPTTSLGSAGTPQAEGSQKVKTIATMEKRESKVSVRTATPDSIRPSTQDGERSISPASPRIPIRSPHRLSKSEVAVASGSAPGSSRTSYESRAPTSPRSSESGHGHGYRNGTDGDLQRPPITISSPPETPMVNLSGRRPSLHRNNSTDLMLKSLKQALAHAADRGVEHVKLDRAFVEAIVAAFESKSDEVIEMAGKLDKMKRASQLMIDEFSVQQEEYDQQLAARRNAEAEVSRLKIELSGQAARLNALAAEEKKKELQQKLSQELSDNLTGLERDLSKLRVERDMTLAEVEELSASKSSVSKEGDTPATATVSRSLTMRLDNIKKQYTHELVPLTQQRESLLREILELKQAREVFLEETAVLNARNEELAQLNAQYERRMEAGVGKQVEQQDAVPASSQTLKTDTWKSSRNAPGLANTLSSSTASSVTLGDDATERVVISKPIQPIQPIQSLQRVEPTEPPIAQTRQAGIGLRWPGKKTNKDLPTHPASSGDNSRGKKRMDHSFQQLSILRIARCDHCAEKMWGSQVRCTSCNLAVHVRCVNSVSLTCMQDSSAEMNEESAVLVSPPPPSMFGRDLIEQVKADSRASERLVPMIVEKCIDAVDTLAMDYEGIYRKSGGSAQSKAITSLFERGDYDAFNLRDSDSFNDIASVTSVLKNYFRNLPNPLLTYTLHEGFIAAAGIRDAQAKSGALSELITKLPVEHFHTLGYLMLHLHRIQQKSDVNLMTARNLGLIFGPTLMRSSEPGREFADMAGKSLVIEWLIENAPVVFSNAIVSR